MDNLCHTLVGAAMGEAGLKRRSRLAHAALMIGANLPDIDVLVFATSTPSVEFRRGWTHGVAAQVLLPVVLVLTLLLVARRHDRAGDPVRPGWLLVCAYLGVYSHVFLDYLNNYGVRLLTPFDWRWFYGDAVFIVDPWLWASLGLGVWLARRQRRPRAAGWALAAAALYIGGMLVAAQTARTRVAEAWTSVAGTPPQAWMVGPVPVTPLRRTVIVDAGDHYRTGTYDVWRGEMSLDAVRVEKHDRRVQVAEAQARAPGIRAFLVWSRFPYWTIESETDGDRVTVWDMRFMAGGARFSQSTLVGARR